MAEYVYHVEEEKRRCPFHRLPYCVQTAGFVTGRLQFLSQESSYADYREAVSWVPFMIAICRVHLTQFIIFYSLGNTRLPQARNSFITHIE